jgi:micrococcal nuclease
MGWLGSPKENDYQTFGALKNWLSNYVEISPQSWETLESLTTYSSTQSIFIGSVCTASFLLGFRVGRIRPIYRRLVDLAGIPSAELGTSAPWLSGRVVSVSDGDTLRFWHVPTVFHSSKPDSDAKLSDQTLSIRICTIDTPETAKFGKPGQPFGDDAKEYLSKLLLDKKCEIQLLTRDQYGRAVGQVRRRSWFGFTTYVDEYMLKAGFAEVYLGSGAVYGSKGKDFYLQLQERAQKANKGQWSQKNRESAADFKARTK